jgi:hypothetical protein
MEENAQLRAEKMLSNTSTSTGLASTVMTTTTTTSTTTTFNATMNNSKEINVANGEQVNLYSTIKSKKISAKDGEHDSNETFKQLKQHSNQIRNNNNSDNIQYFDSPPSLQNLESLLLLTSGNKLPTIFVKESDREQENENYEIKFDQK